MGVAGAGGGRHNTKGERQRGWRAGKDCQVFITSSVSPPLLVFGSWALVVSSRGPQCSEVLCGPILSLWLCPNLSPKALKT